MKQLQLLGRSIRYTPLSQLLARARLIARRRWNDSVGAHRSTSRDIKPPPSLSPSPAQPLFGARASHRSRRADEPILNLVGTDLCFQVPMTWRPDNLARGSLEMLTLHYTEFIEGITDPESVMLDWIASNPETERGAWKDAWNSYAISIRSLVWMQQLATRPDAFSPQNMHTIVTSIASQVRYLERNLELDIRGNHLIKNVKCLMWAGRFFDGDEASSWFAKGNRLLEESIAEQILDDGMHFERSASYHNQVLADLAECYALMDDSDGKWRLGDTLDAMAQVSVDLTHPDGYPSMMNDGGFTMAYACDEILSVLRTLGRDPVYPRRIIELPHAGYYGIRTGPNLLLIDCGPIGPDALPAHAHGDVLSFEWSVNGERVIVDPGVHEYRPGARRSYARSTAAHNTVAIDSHDQAEFWSSFRVGRRPSVAVQTFDVEANTLTLSGSHDGYSRLPGSPIHYRTFEASETRVDILDRVIGGRGQRVTSGLLVAPSFDLVTEPDGVTITGEEICLRVAGNATFTVEDAQYSTDIGHSEGTKRIVADLGPAPTVGHLSLTLLPVPDEAAIEQS